ncbi:MAG TPA: hypothetical protein VM120_15965 [Bryobacteraceae bacterium]|nr:hypothetical protein [Bryobacteraceae bacterium]
MTRRSLLSGWIGLPLLAQSKQQKGKKIIDEVVAALGGPAFLEMRDRVETGRVYSFYREQLSGRSQARIYTRYLTRPDSPALDYFGVRERQSFGKDKEESAVLFTETEGWQITFRGARPVAKDMEARFRDSTRRNVFYILRQRLGEPGLIFDYEGSDIVENVPVDIVSITDRDNRVVKVFFHQSTRLPLRQEYVRRDETTREKFDEVTRFAKYRQIKGVQWPFQIQRERNGEKIYEIFSDSVTINTDLNDDMFTLSGKIKVLPPAR